MLREMRRNRQALSREECEAILERGSSGVLAVAGDDEYPYAVPLSYVYQSEGSLEETHSNNRVGTLYFHCAKSGHKLDALTRNPKASFCVIDQDEIIPEKYTTYFRSVIVFGTVRIVEEDQEKQQAAELLALKYSPGESEESRAAEIKGAWERLCMMEMSIEHMSGKEAKELRQQKGKL